MKRKIGTVIELALLTEAKQRAAQEDRALAEVIQDALGHYLHEVVGRGDAVRACAKFCAHGSSLNRQEIDELLREDVLAL